MGGLGYGSDTPSLSSGRMEQVREAPPTQPPPPPNAPVSTSVKFSFSNISIFSDCHADDSTQIEKDGHMRHSEAPECQVYLWGRVGNGF